VVALKSPFRAPQGLHAPFATTALVIFGAAAARFMASRLSLGSISPVSSVRQPADPAAA